VPSPRLWMFTPCPCSSRERATINVRGLDLHLQAPKAVDRRPDRFKFLPFVDSMLWKAKNIGGYCARCAPEVRATGTKSTQFKVPFER
jgi:hypothetical protein